MKQFFFAFMLILFVHHDTKACTKKGCASTAALEFICKDHCPEQIRVLVDEEVVYNSCKKDSWKGFHGMQSYFTLNAAKENGRFSVSMAPTKSIKNLRLFGGSSCKKLTELVSQSHIELKKSEYYPNGKKCDKVPCVSYDLPAPIEL